MNRKIKIDSLESLQAEILLVKRRIQLREEDLAERWERLPQETIKASLGSVIPLFMNSGVAGIAWKLLKSGFGLFLSKKQKKEEESEKPGFMGILKSVIGLFNK